MYPNNCDDIDISNGVIAICCYGIMHVFRLSHGHNIIMYMYMHIHNKLYNSAAIYRNFLYHNYVMETYVTI